MKLTGIVVLVICFPCFSIQIVNADGEKTDAGGREVVGVESKGVIPEEVSIESEVVMPGEVDIESEEVMPEEVSVESKEVMPEEVSIESKEVMPEEVSIESKEIMPEEVVAEPGEAAERGIDERQAASGNKAIIDNDTVELSDEVSKAQRIDTLLLSWKDDLQSGQDNDQPFLQKLVGRTLFISGRTTDECLQAKERMSGLTDMDDFLERIKVILITDASNEQIDMMIQWRQSDMAKMIKAIKDKLSTDGIGYIVDNYKDILNNSDEERSRIAKNILECVDFEASMTSLYGSIVNGINLSKDTDNEVDYSAIAEAIFLTKYQDISVEELKQYEAFLMAAGGIFCRAIYRAADDIFSELAGNENTDAYTDKDDSTLELQ